MDIDPKADFNRIRNDFSSKKSAHYGALIIFVCTQFTCCFNSNTMIDGVFNAKTVWFCFITGTLLIFSGIVFFGSKQKLKINQLDSILFLFIAYLILNNSLHSRWFLTKQNMENIGLLSLYFFTKKIFSEKKSSNRWFITFILLLTFSQILIASLQWFEYIPSLNSNFRFTGFFFNPAPFAIFLSCLLICCMAIFFCNRSNPTKTVALSLFISGLPLILISVSRAAWLGLLGGMAVVIIANLPGIKKMIRNKEGKIKAVRLLLLLPVMAIFFVYLYHLKQDSADGRVLVWKVSSNMIPDHFSFGVGQGRFQASYLNYQSQYFRSHPGLMLTEGRLAGTVAYAFNDMLQIFVEQGIMGIVLFLAVVISSIKFSYSFSKIPDPTIPKGNRALVTASSACLITIMISGLFSYTLTMLPIQIIFYSSLGILSANVDLFFSPKPGNRNFVIKPVLIRHIQLVSIIAGILYLIYSVASNHVYNLANEVKSNGYKDSVMKQLDRYDPIIEQEPWYKMTKCDYFVYAGRYDEAISLLERSKQITSDTKLYYALGELYSFKKQFPQAETQFEFLYYALPGLLKPKYLLAKLYYKSGQTAKWNRAAQEIMAFKPKIASAATNSMLLDIQNLAR